MSKCVNAKFYNGEKKGNSECFLKELHVQSQQTYSKSFSLVFP